MSLSVADIPARGRQRPAVSAASPWMGRGTVGQVTIGFGAAILSAVCYGTATALQARGASGTTREPQAHSTTEEPQTHSTTGEPQTHGAATAVRARGAGGASAAPRTDVRGLIRVLRRWPFLLGLLLDLAGFAAQLVALRSLPLFVVQAAQAGNLAVTALVAVPVLGVRLRASQWAAVLAVCAGLALLGVSGGPEGTTGGGNWALLAAALVVAAGSVGAARLGPRTGPVALGVAAGLGFGVAALAVRALPGFALVPLLHNPATYALAVSGPTALLTFTAALQRGAVTTVAALMIIGETVLPGAVGVVLWHDRTRPGWALPALAGFVLAVAGALALARFADPEPA